MMADLVLFSIRIDDTTRRKLKVIAGYEDRSINSVIMGVIADKIADWESKHGAIELPPA